MTRLRVLIRGGGDLGSGVGLRLHRVGAFVVFAELPKPLVVRRYVSFAEAVISGSTFVEEVFAQKVNTFEEIFELLEKGIVPVVVDPMAQLINWWKPDVLVDARLKKSPPETDIQSTSMVIGLGPGFIAGVNCHAVIETKRGPMLGRVYWSGTAEADSGLPESVNGYVEERVLRAPTDGLFKSHVRICDFVTAGQAIGEVNGIPIHAQFDGVIRGLVMDGLQVTKGMKVGDVDPRKDPRLCSLVSDKSLAIGGGVLEAILSRSDLRRKLCDE